MSSNKVMTANSGPPTQRVVFFPKTHEGLLKGATILAGAVASTMGPSGHSVIIDMEVGPPQITKDGVTVARSINLKDRLQSMGAELLKEVASKTNDVAGDGPQPLYSKVLTPSGWKLMGEVKVGDRICGTNNSMQEVLGVFPKGQKDIYRVALTDGNLSTRFVECSEEHLWSVNTYCGVARTMTTKEMLDSGLQRKEGGGKYFVTRTSVDFEDNTEQLPLDPYLLGVLLGDGSLSTNHEVEIATGLGEGHILEKIILPKNCRMRTRTYAEKHFIKAVITGSVRKGASRGTRVSVIKNILSDLGLLGTNSHNKFIPRQYLYTSIENRQKLLNGLIDTDGFINDRGLFGFSTVSKQLSADFVELCRSLGKPTYCGTINRKPNGGSYSDRPIFRICELKGNNYGLKISAIEKTNEQTEMMCIKVSNPDHLYITDDYTPTHNTTTSVVLGHALLAEGVKMISTNRSSIDLKKGMDVATEQVIDYLKNNCIPLSSREDIVNVGTISANGDRSIGELLATAIEKVGRDGIITVEPAKSIQTTLDIVEGMQVDGGYVSPFFITNSEKAVCELDNPYVLLTPNKISSIQDIISILEGVAKNSKSLLIIADDVEGDALHTLIVNKTKGIIKVCAVKAPSYGEHRADSLSDIQILTGGTVFGATTDLSIRNATVEHLGTAKKVIVGRGTTTIIGVANSERKKLVEERITSLRTLLEDGTQDALHVDKTRKRLAKLSGGIAVIKVGGSTELEILEKKDRVEDAVNATIAATQEGIVPGGGVALFYAAQSIKELLRTGTYSELYTQDVVAGIEMVANVCESPFRTIVKNTGVSPDVVAERLIQNHKDHKVFYVDVGTVQPEEMAAYIEQVKREMAAKQSGVEPNRLQFRFGYNAATGKYHDLVTEGIIDPVKVTRCALEHAVSVIGLVLTCNSVIVNEEENEG